MSTRATKAFERTLSLTLMAGAFSFIGLAIFASASFVDKVSPTALLIGNILIGLAVIALIASIMFGGWGMTRIDSGPSNKFNLQSLCGLAGVALLLGAAGVFAFNPKPSKGEIDASLIEARFQRIEGELAALRSELSKLRDRAPCPVQQNPPPTSCPQPGPPEMIDQK